MDYLATPTGVGPWPAVVVVHEIFGLSDDIKAKADRMAEHGYLALAVDLFEGRRGVRCMMSAFRQLRAGRGPMFAVIEAGRRGLAARDDCTGQVGVLGFCMGGSFALLAAPRGFDAAAANYPHLPKEPEEALSGACPIVASFGGADLSLRGAAAKLERVLAALDVPHNVKEYPGAGHAYMTDYRQNWMIEKVTGIQFKPEATRDTWRRIDDFFGHYLER